MWERVEKKGMRGGAAHYGSRWDDQPCVSFCKDRISFNKRAIQVFGMHPGRFMDLYVDRERPGFAFKLMPKDCDGRGYWKIQAQGTSRTSFSVHANTILKRLPAWLVGNAYELVLNQEAHLIEAVIEPPDSVSVPSA